MDCLTYIICGVYHFFVKSILANGLEGMEAVHLLKTACYGVSYTGHEIAQTDCSNASSVTNIIKN